MSSCSASSMAIRSKSSLPKGVSRSIPKIRIFDSSYCTDGRRYEGVPGTHQFRVVEFAEHGIPYRLPSLDPPDPEPREMRVG